jgi:hypothetical protein
METADERNRHNNFAKLCRNGCGKYIRRDITQSKYFEIDTNNLHICPNWSPNLEKVSSVLTSTITPEQQIYLDTIGPEILKILPLIQEIHQRTVREPKKDE